MTRWLSKFDWLDACSGLEIHRNEQNQYSLRSVSILVKGDRLDLGKKESLEAGDLKSGLGRLALKGPVAVTITGKGVLIRKVPPGEYNVPASVHAVFPNLDAEQFYIQQFRSGDSLFLALIRKETAHSILADCDTAGLQVLSLSLGPFSAAHILSQLNNYGDRVLFGGHSIKLSEDKTWEEYHYDPFSASPFPVKAGMEAINEHLVLAYATAFQLALYPRLESVAVHPPAVDSRFFAFRDGRKLKVRAAGLIACFFVLLLINFGLFSYYQSSNAALLEQVDMYQSSDRDLMQLQEEIDKKQDLLEKLSWNGGTRYAFICDQVGETVPDSIQITSLIVNPAESKATVNTIGKIVIDGLSNGTDAVNQWMTRLKTLTWVQSVRLKRFSSSEEDTDLQEFSMIVSY
jgi:Tfp pilus assembly protein PilN